MGKAKITITGEASKPPKIKDNGSVDLLLKVDMSQSVPKGLKSLGSSFCIIHIGKKTWKKVSENVKDDTFYIIQGEVKANINNKNVPFLEIVAFDISLKTEAVTKEISKKKEPEKEIPKQIEAKEKKEVQKQKVDIQNKPQPKKPDLKDKKNEMIIGEWYNSEEIIYVSHKDIIVTENIHLMAKMLQLNGVFRAVHERKTIKTPIAVRQVGERYVLVMGLKNYVAAKILELENIPVVIRDMTNKEFVAKYRVK